MAVKTIPELPEKTSKLEDSNLFVVDDGEHSYKLPWSFFKTMLTGVTAIEQDSTTGVLTLTLADGSTLPVTITDPTKQDKLTFDTTPTANSTNPVTSGGLYIALAGKVDTSTLAGYVKLTNYQNTVQNIYAQIGDTYDENTNYAVGDYVLYSNTLYRCKTAYSGAWTAANWEEIQITDALKELVSSLATQSANTGQLSADGTYIKKSNTMAANDAALDTALADLGLSVVNGQLCITYDAD